MQVQSPNLTPAANDDSPAEPLFKVSPAFLPLWSKRQLGGSKAANKCQKMKKVGKETYLHIGP